jgi:hypothetical protein
MPTNTIAIKSRKHIIENHAMEGWASCSDEDFYLADLNAMLREAQSILKKAQEKNAHQAEHFVEINKFLERR